MRWWNVVAKKTGGDARFALMTAAAAGRRLGAARRLGRSGRRCRAGARSNRRVLLASAIVHVVYFTTLLRGYRLADLTVVYPVARGTGPLLTSLGALVWLGERLSARRGGRRRRGRDRRLLHRRRAGALGQGA